MLDITVSDPETHSGTKVTLSFVDFKVHTVTDDGAIVPPLPPPDKPYKGELNRFSADFIARRQAGLELFLRRVAVHPKLAVSTDLLTFLEAKVWELQTAKNASTDGWVSSLLASTEASMKRAASALSKKTPDNDPVEKLRTFAAEYYSVVKAAEAMHHTTVTTLADAAGDLSHLGPAFDLLSQSERELSLPFTYTARALDALRELFLKQVQVEHVSGLSALLAFNSGMASSLKDVLKNRDQALVQYNKATALVDARTNESQKWHLAQGAAGAPTRPQASTSSSGSGGMMSSLMGKLDTMINDPNKGTKLQNRVSEAEQALAVCKARWDDVSQSLDGEAAAFHATTNADFSKGLREHIHQQLAFEEAQQKHWRELLAIFDQMLWLQAEPKAH